MLPEETAVAPIATIRVSIEDGGMVARMERTKDLSENSSG